MQEFDFFLKTLKITEELTDNISKLLDGNVDGKEVELERLYEKRKTFVRDLSEFSSSEQYRNWLDEDNNNLKDRINFLVLKDKENMQKIDTITKEKGNKLKDLMSKKSLLIYKD